VHTSIAERATTAQPEQPSLTVAVSAAFLEHRSRFSEAAQTQGFEAEVDQSRRG
jgi:hypothetical protein